jgi:hypothetical protein
MLRLALLTAIAVAGTAPALAAEKEHRQHGAHEHGAAELKLVWEKNVVTIELETPAVNIVGFEHAPRTDAQKKAVRDAVATLRGADKLFHFTPEAGCRGATTDVKSELTDAKPGQKLDHSEFEAGWRFTCDKPNALKAVDVELLKLFPKMHKLRAQSVSPKGQTATELKPGQARLSLR